jgi:prevent-host-death family protein
MPQKCETHKRNFLADRIGFPNQLRKVRILRIMTENRKGEITMTTVSASEFQRNFGHFKEVAQREPVIVTSNGRESVVLLSATEYAELKKYRYAYSGEVTDEFKQDVDEFMGEHAAVLEGLAQ